MGLGVTVMAWMIIGVAAGMTAAPGGAQELRSSCDGDHGGTVSAEEAHGCAEQRFDLACAGADDLAVEQFAPALPDADGLRRQFAQADEDGDGRISRDEWMRWFGPAYAETTKGADGQPSGTD